MSEASDTKTINLLNNGEFQSRDISSDTVLELRTELDIPADSSVNIGGTVRQTTFHCLTEIMLLGQVTIK